MSSCYSVIMTCITPLPISSSAHVMTRALFLGWSVFLLIIKTYSSIHGNAALCCLPMQESTTNGSMRILEASLVEKDLLHTNWTTQQKKQFAAMSQVGYRRGGDFDYGGIFWADRSDTIMNPLEGYHQFVGHSRVDNIHHVTINDQTSITYCDCLHNKQYLVITEQGINSCYLNWAKKSIYLLSYIILWTDYGIDEIFHKGWLQPI